MKKITFSLLCFALCFSMCFGAFAEGIKITVDGVEVKQVNAEGNPVPEIEQEDAQNPMVPIRAVLKAMGYYVDYVDGAVVGGVKAEPEIKLTAGEDCVLTEGTAFVPYGMLGRENGINYTAEYKDATVAYTNIYADLQEGWYNITCGDKYLTGEVLPEGDKVETVTNEDGTTEEKTVTPQEQIRGRNVALADKNDSTAQLWLVKRLNGKTYVIINKNNGLALDVNSWSTEIGAAILQYTYAGGANQQWNFVKNGENYSLFSVNSKLPVSYDSESDAVVQVSGSEPGQWGLNFVKAYTNPVELALETEAYNELDSTYRERFKTYFFTDVDFSQSAKDKAETFLRESGFEEADKETQKSLIIQCLDITYSDLLGGWMREKLTADFKITGVEEKTVKEWRDDAEVDVLYYVHTVEMDCGGETHTFTVETVDKDDDEHVEKVCEAVACFEPPIRKTLRHFYYTGQKLGTWNAWDGEVWNNTGSKFDVDGMLTMFAHELGHVIDSYFKVGDDVWRRAVVNDIIPTSGYGKTNRWEDFGEFSRLYLMSRGDEERMAAIEKIYPNRTKTYRAALYNADNEYYKEYKECYDEVTAPIGNTEELDRTQYYFISDGLDTFGPSERSALTNKDGALVFEKYTGAANQLWQIVAEDEQLVKIYSKADGTSVTVPSQKLNETLSCDTNNATALGAKLTKHEELNYYDAEFTVSESGFGIGAYLDESDENVVLKTSKGAMTDFYIAPVEKIEGLGSFTIKSGDKYLVPSGEDNGAQLILSEEKGDMSVWNINKLPNGEGYITNAKTEFAIDISGASEEDGASALAYTLSRNANQMWLIEENANGTVSFKARHSGLYLAADAEGKAVQSAERYEWTMEESK